MFDPNNLASILKWDDKNLSSLPSAEDDFNEYKSSFVKDADLVDKIARAASGFWNSGGGLFVAGVNGSGQPDGGIGSTVGRQARRDWVDQAIARVMPMGQYVVHCIQDHGAGVKITPGNVVVLIGFAPSEIGPHMAPDNRYYIRTGAHTAPASHFLVESIWARRHLTKPRLVHVLNVESFSTQTSFIVVDLVSVTGSPALDVEIDLSPRPTINDGEVLKLPLRTTLIDALHHYVFRFEIPLAGFQTELSATYADLAGNRFDYRAQIDTATCIPAWNRGGNALDAISRSLDQIGRILERSS